MSENLCRDCGHTEDDHDGYGGLCDGATDIASRTMCGCDEFRACNTTATPPLAADHAQARIEGWIALDATGGRMADDLFVSQEVALREWPTAHAVPVFTALAAASPGEGREPECEGCNDTKSIRVIADGVDIGRQVCPMCAPVATPPAAPAVGVTEKMVLSRVVADPTWAGGGYIRFDDASVAVGSLVEYAALRGTEG